MVQTTPDILALSGEAAALARAGQIVYANARAKELLGSGCVGRSLRELLGEEIAAAQASSFITDVLIGGRLCAARFARCEEGMLIFLSPAQPDPAILNDPLLFSLRSSLMDLGIITDSLRERAEESGDAFVRSKAVSMGNCYYRLLRQVENASLTLALSRGQAAVNLCSVDLAAICRDTAEAVTAFFPALQISSELPESAWITADPALFKQLLFNLLSNCLLHASCSHVRLRLSETERSVVLALSDDGCGIEEEMLQQAFERYRYAFDLKRIHCGPGLGLGVSRGIAMLHGGALLMESRLGRGTTVRATFSKLCSPGNHLQTADTGGALTSRELLTGLADCLPEEAFTERYLD